MTASSGLNERILMDVKVNRNVAWSYTEPGLTATCRIDGSRGTVRLTLDRAGSEFHDCLKVKAWVQGWLKDNPTTAEEFLCAVADQYPGYAVEVEWRSENHGPITVKTWGK